jgi:DNA repair protein RadC
MLIQRKGKHYTLNRPVTEEEMIKIVKHLFLSRYIQRRKSINNLQKCKDYLQTEFANCEREIFCVIFLDTRHRVLALEKVFIGSVHTTTIYPREIVKLALKYNAAATILVHNHPSGSIDASKEDVKLTNQVAKILKMVDVSVLDHLIVGTAGILSLVETKIWCPSSIKTLS